MRRIALWITHPQARKTQREGAMISDTTCLLISVGKSTPPHDRLLDIFISNSQQLVDYFVEGLTFSNQLIDRAIAVIVGRVSG